MQGRAEVFACHGFVLVLKWSMAILACVAGGFLGVIFESQKKKHTPKTLPATHSRSYTRCNVQIYFLCRCLLLTNLLFVMMAAWKILIVGRVTRQHRVEQSSLDIHCVIKWPVRKRDKGGGIDISKLKITTASLLFLDERQT